jgi:hypothetical protein
MTNPVEDRSDRLKGTIQEFCDLLREESLSSDVIMDLGPVSDIVREYCSLSHGIAKASQHLRFGGIMSNEEYVAGIKAQLMLLLKSRDRLEWFFYRLEEDIKKEKESN